MRNVKIVCTLGPSSASHRVVEDLVSAGMSVARINASHGDPEDLRALLTVVREVDARTPEPISTILDIQGPEIRTTQIEAPVEIPTGSEVRFRHGAITDGTVIGLSQSIQSVSPGDQILVDDGRIACVVEAVEDTDVLARVDHGGELGSRKGVNIPGVNLGLDMVTEKDRADLALATEGQVDFVATSFVREAADVLEVSAVLEDLKCDVPIIAKIERADAVRNIDEIIDASYGIMVARGDLGVECPMEDVPLMQKRIIRRCQAAGVPVITATEMLDSMVEARRPTRAEASDVANAVLDGTDAVMLSAETAVGEHPVLVVETMDRIVREVETSEEYADLLEQRVPPASESRTDALARSGRYLARDLGADAIVASSETGYTALKTAKFRPGVPTIAVTLSPKVCRQLTISWGVRPHLSNVEHPTSTAVVDDAVRSAIEDEIAESGSTIVVITGLMREIEDAGLTNTLKVHVAAQTAAIGRVVVAGRSTAPAFLTDDGDLSDMPEGAIVLLSRTFDGEFVGGLSRIGGVVSSAPGLTGYPAMIARELDIPMISAATYEQDIQTGTTVTLDAERGVLYQGDITTPSLIAERENS